MRFSLRTTAVLTVVATIAGGCAGGGSQGAAVPIASTGSGSAVTRGDASSAGSASPGGHAPFGGSAFSGGSAAPSGSAFSGGKAAPAGSGFMGGNAFFGVLRPGEGAALTRPPASLEAALAEATATVEAEVTAVRPGRMIHDLRFALVELKVAQVLDGGLQPELDGRVRVEFALVFAPDPVEPVIGRMRADLPRGRQVWLLRWQGAPPETAKPGAGQPRTADPQLYRTVHPTCGVLAQGAEGGVVAPLSPPGAGPRLSGAQAEAERFTTVADLIVHIRQR